MCTVSVYYSANRVPGRLIVDQMMQTILKQISLFCIPYYKKRLNSDGQQFHEYQESHINSLNTKKVIMTYDVRNPSTDMGQVQKCGRVKLVNGIPTFYIYLCQKVHLQYKDNMRVKYELVFTVICPYYKRQELPTPREHMDSPPVYCRVIHLFSFLCCILFVFVFCEGTDGSMSQVVELPNNSYKPITNTKCVRARLCKLQKRVHSTRSRK